MCVAPAELTKRDFKLAHKQLASTHQKWSDEMRNTLALRLHGRDWKRFSESKAVAGAG